MQESHVGTNLMFEPEPEANAMKRFSWVGYGCFSMVLGLALSAMQVGSKALLLFGDSKHETFLGCLNCQRVSEASVCNPVGKYGSPVEDNSIWNPVGQYGSPVSDISPCNVVSDTAPIIVDKDGTSYGYFSANRVHHDRTQIDWLAAALDYYAQTRDLRKTRNRICGE
jgi:hypothetical protein